MVLSGMLIAAEPREDEIILSQPELVTAASDYPFRTVYPSLSNLTLWYDSLVAEYPDLVTKLDIGNSWQGRDLWVLELTADEDTVVAEKPGVLITGGTHAREWSGMQASAYFAWFLLYNYETNDTIHWLLNNRRVYIAPQVNPDGYYYDGNGNYAAKLSWRKNRNDSTPTEAIGVDLNRNWDIAWSAGNNDPAALDYHGVSPFSEYETKALRDFIIANGIESFQDIHSYAGTLLIPWCYTGNPSPHDSWYRGTAAKMTSLTTQMGAATTYTYGQPDETIGYSAPGGSIDWTYDALGIQSYCFELATGGAGFYPTTANIMTINQDVDDALLYQARIADVDIGDGTTDLFPPVPYILFGKAAAGSQVTLLDKNTAGTISITADSRGYYELNFGNLASYTGSHAFQVYSQTGSVNFSIGAEWGRRIDLLAPESVISQTVEHWGSHSSTGTRFLRGIATESTVNGLTSYSLGLANSNTAGNWGPGNNVNIYLGIRVYKRTAAGVETEITSGTPVAQVARTAAGIGFQTATWTPPVTALAITDSIIVRVHGDTTSPPTTLRATLSTEQLGATQLDAKQWTLQYWTRMAGTPNGSDWYWGTVTYENSIAGFSHTTVLTEPLEHNTVNWTHSGSTISGFNIYRSDSQAGPWTLAGTVAPGSRTYCDQYKGEADATQWWYIVKAVSLYGIEDGNDFAVQEPGAGTPYSIILAGRSGWVFVSYPVTVSGHIETVLNDAANGDGGTNWDVAKTWSNQQKAWLTYRKGGTANTFTDVENLKGYWLHLTANGGDQALSVPPTGAYPGNSVINLYAGWNLVGYPSATSRLASNTLPAQVDTVSEWQAASPYISDKVPGDVTMSHGNGYWVRTTADCFWVVEP